MRWATPYATRVGHGGRIRLTRSEPASTTVFSSTAFFAQKVYPGHLNYDNAVGTNGSADLPKQLDFSSMIYCLYSDYKSEQVDHNPPQDSTIHGINPYHGSSKKSSSKSARLVVGDAVKGISVFGSGLLREPLVFGG